MPEYEKVADTRYCICNKFEIRIHSSYSASQSLKVQPPTMIQLVLPVLKSWYAAIYTFIVQFFINPEGSLFLSKF